MATTSIPKQRLVEFIVDDLDSSAKARQHFGIGEDSEVFQRLLSVTKPKLVAFVQSLGEKASGKLSALSTQFPMYRPPTLYLAVVGKAFQERSLIYRSRALAALGRDGIDNKVSSGTIRCLHTSDPAKRQALDGGRAIQLTISYERRIDIVSSDTESDSYGTLVNVFSLETAFVWLPIVADNKHGVIACCDYPAVRHILDYLRRNYGLFLTLPNLDTMVIEELVQGATPRSVTFRRLQENTYTELIQTVTLADPALPLKKPFHEATNDETREQSAGFYIKHPAMADGGLGVSRRDGKVWTPKKLDRLALANLALGLIKKTEKQLAQLIERGSIRELIEHYFGSSADIDDRALRGKQLDLWRELAAKVVEASDNDNKESRISSDMLTRLIKSSKPLDLVVCIQHECPTCQVQELARCPHCQNPLTITYNDGQPAPSCATCHRSKFDSLECDCGESIVWADLNSSIHIVPLPGLLESMARVFEKLGKPVFDGMFFSIGNRIKFVFPQRKSCSVIDAHDLSNWRKNLQLAKSIDVSRSNKLVKILNKTKEKCKRNWAVPKKTDCEACNKGQLPSQWIETGQICLARMLGQVLGKEFDGIHHGHEVADIRYQDKLKDLGTVVNVGVHLKSRMPKPPEQGMGRSKDPIKGLYTQLVFSAYLASEKGQALDVLGVGIPNIIHVEALRSLEYATTRLGYFFIALQETHWLAIADRALEIAEFDASMAGRKGGSPI